MADRNTPGAAEKEFVITRIIDAPRECVFAAWTEPRHLEQWWGPKGFTSPVCEAEARPGGTLRIVMRAPDGTLYPMEGIFRKVASPKRLVFTNIAVDDKGNHLLEGLTTVTFADHGGKTKLIVQTRAVAVVAPAAAFLEGMDAGWTQSIDRLDARVTGAHAS